MNESIDISPNKDGGILKLIVKEGNSDDSPPKGCKVCVHYTGTFTNGVKFDSSRDRNEAFSFDLGRGTVIKAWDIGVASMKKGERAILTCSPDYAYGEAGSPPAIPPNATLKFDIEVISWQGEDLSLECDGGIERFQITPGEGQSTPNEAALVNVHISGRYENNIFDDRQVSFCVGEGSEVNVIPGIETAILKFKKGEKSRLIVKPMYAFGKKGSPEFNIPPNAVVEYVVTLLNFERAKDIWCLDSQEKIEQAKLFKDKGTSYFKAGKYELAIKLYERVEKYLGNSNDAPDEERFLLLSSYLNISLCQLKLQDYFKARDAANSALKIDPNNEKALYRRGQALFSINDPNQARKDFIRCLEINPGNMVAKSQLDLCNKAIKKQLFQEKKVYANMFDKFAKMDTQREEFERTKQPNVMSSVGEWGQEDREREPSEFEKENPDILLLNKTGEFKDM